MCDMNVGSSFLFFHSCWKRFQPRNLLGTDLQPSWTRWNTQTGWVEVTEFTLWHRGQCARVFASLTNAAVLLLSPRQARLWVQLMKELRQGVKLKKVQEQPFDPLPTEFSLTPFEMLMQDIRARNFQLRKVMVRVQSVAQVLLKPGKPLKASVWRNKSHAPPRVAPMHSLQQECCKQQKKLPWGLLCGALFNPFSPNLHEILPDSVVLASLQLIFRTWKWTELTSSDVTGIRKFNHVKKTLVALWEGDSVVLELHLL